MATYLVMTPAERRRAELRDQLAGCELRARLIAEDIARKWRGHAASIRTTGLHNLPNVHEYEQRLRALLAECKRLRRELGA